jgi:hypothetical protein
MADDAMLDVDRLPTLTEVLELGRQGGAQMAASTALEPANPLASAGHGAAEPSAALGDPVAQVLALLEPRIGDLLATRLREALAPAVARAADGLIRDVQAELGPTLRSLVEEAVAQALRQPRLPK